MTLASELAVLANDYISGRRDLHALDMWLTKHAPEIARRDEDDSTVRLSGMIETTLAEIDREHASEDDLKSRIKAFLAEKERSRPQQRATG